MSHAGPTPAPDDSEPIEPQGKRSDCFAPPRQPCECYCLHCNRVFMSDEVWFQKVINARDGFDGFWMCPTHNCDGAGFTFDIFPTDQDHPANQSWEYSEDGEEEFPEQEQAENGKGEYDPDEPRYAELDEIYGDDDDDIEGEEWKLGLQPGERPPEPPWAEKARREWEESQRKYDEPDERPRVVDWSERPDPSPPKPRTDGPPGEISEDDIPF